MRYLFSSLALSLLALLIAACGGGTGTPCKSIGDCPASMAGGCQLSTCDDGYCGIAAELAGTGCKASGSPTGTGSCDGQGNCVGQ